MGPSSEVQPFRQLVSAGWTSERIKRATATGELRRLRRGVFSTGPPAPVQDEHYRQLVTAVARESGDPLLSHQSALALYELPMVGADLTFVHTTATHASGGQRRGGVHRHVAHRVDEVRRIDGVRVTSPARTLIDVARTSPWRTSVPAIDAALRGGVVRGDALALELDACGRQHGVALARTAVKLADGRCESPGESLSRVAMHVSGLELPTSQVDVLSATGAFLGRCDFLFEGTAALGEFDGLTKYGGIPDGPDARSALIAEKLREDAIRAEGGVMCRWIWRDLHQPDAWMDRLRRAIELGRRALDSGQVTLTFRPVR